jgi:tryptophan synthase alpha subunit
VPPPERLAVLRRAGPPPVIGFGISRPRQVHEAIAAGAAGVIVGSALIDEIDAGRRPGEFIACLKASTRRFDTVP